MNQKRTPEQWDDIMQRYATYEGSTVQFCRDFNIPQQTLYSQLKRRQVASISKRQFVSSDTSADKPSFIKASLISSTLTLHTQHAQLNLPSQCDPVWLATLLKGLSA